MLVILKPLMWSRRSSFRWKQLIQIFCRWDQAQCNPEECKASDEGGVFALLTRHRFRRGLWFPGTYCHGEQGHGSEDLRQPRRSRAATGTARKHNKKTPSNSASLTFFLQISNFLKSKAFLYFKHLIFRHHTPLTGKLFSGTQFGNEKVCQSQYK